MAVYDTTQNKRTEYTRRTLWSLLDTVDLKTHRLFVIDNASCQETKDILKEYKSKKPCPFTLITNKENIGTAEAINLAWKHRQPGEHCIKIDNDVYIHEEGWVNLMEEVIRRDSTIGQVGLKRKDCWEKPDHENPFYRSELLMLPHQPGEKWILAEKVNHVMGTCVMHSSALLDKVGYLYQPGIYGFDDSFMSLRANLAGFKCVFIPNIEIEHIDIGGTPYQSWKEKHAGGFWVEYHKIVEGYKSGKIPIYYSPFK